VWAADFVVLAIEIIHIRVQNLRKIADSMTERGATAGAIQVNLDSSGSIRS
jgi:hypothetical protein